MAEISEIRSKLTAETRDAPEEVQQLAQDPKLAEALSELGEDQPALLRSRAILLPG